MKFDLGENWFKNGWKLKQVIYQNLDKSKPLKLLEIGSWKGRSTIWFCENVLHHADSVIYCVDPWCLDNFNDFNDDDDLQLKYKNAEPDYIYKQFLYNIEFKNCSEKCKTFRMTSGEAVSEINENDFDMIYVDGDHSYQGCLEDLENYYPKLKTGGILFGDDWYMKGVREAAIDFATNNGYTLHKPFHIGYLFTMYNGYYFIKV